MLLLRLKVIFPQSSSKLRWRLPLHRVLRSGSPLHRYHSPAPTSRAPSSVLILFRFAVPRLVSHSLRSAVNARPPAWATFLSLPCSGVELIGESTRTGSCRSLACMPRSRTPADRVPPHPYVAPRCCLPPENGVSSAISFLSRFQSRGTVQAPPVYASQPGSPPHHAALGPGWLATLYRGRTYACGFCSRRFPVRCHRRTTHTFLLLQAYPGAIPLKAQGVTLAPQTRRFHGQPAQAPSGAAADSPAQLRPLGRGSLLGVGRLIDVVGDRTPGGPSDAGCG